MEKASLEERSLSAEEKLEVTVKGKLNKDKP